VSKDFVTSLTDEEKELCCFEKVANKEFENMEDSLDSMTASYTLLQMMYKTRGAVIDAKDKIIDSLESEAEEKDKIIANLKSEVKEKDRNISALKSAVKEKDKIIPAVSGKYQVPTELAANMVNTEPMSLVNPLGSIEGNVKFDQQYRRMKRKSLSPDFVEVGNNNKGGEGITEDMPASKKLRSGNCERLDKNNTITASNVNRICVDDEAKIGKLKLEKRQQVENEMLRKELRDKDEALEQSRELNNVLILKEHQQNNELQQIRKILIH
ncbi:hypothetical protein MKW94_012807, partial [Papaver nudicaule]|nr:hypothetical protein [Papaver nudicaule]